MFAVRGQQSLFFRNVAHHPRTLDQLPFNMRARSGGLYKLFVV